MILLRGCRLIVRHVVTESSWDGRDSAQGKRPFSAADVDRVLGVDRWSHGTRAVQPAVVPPVDVLEERELELVEGSPRPIAGDQFSLVGSSKTTEVSVRWS